MESIKSQIVWAHQLGVSNTYRLDRRTIQLIDLLRYPKIVDIHGSVWMVDDHGVLIEGRNVAPTTAPNPWHISTALTWIGGNVQHLFRCKTAFNVKTKIDTGTQLYVTNGAALLALSALGYRLALPSRLGSGDMQIIRPIKTRIPSSPACN